MSLIVVQELNRTYASGEKSIDAVRDVNFNVAPGSRVAVVGRSGSGKSTLLHLLAGLDRPTSGDIIVNGIDLGSLSSRRLAEYRALTVGMVFQAYHLIPGKTAFQNVELPLLLAGQPPAKRRAAVDEALHSVGLEGRRQHRPSQLSGGEQQRVAIARALVAHPQVLLADEPTGNLDSQTAGEIEKLLLKEVHERKLCVLLVTHDRELAGRFAQRTLTMQDGRLTSADSPATSSFEGAGP